ncbi:MAG: hydroxysqualene dehydroxylase HpnE [Caulobacteraceae bacterium]
MKTGDAPAKVYVIGAGLAGLSAAVALAGRGVQVEVIEAAAQAGGRCRSYHDGVLDMTLDNGNHFILSGNHAAFAYLRAIGAEDRMVGPAEARLDFVDRRDGVRWTIAPNTGPLPWWLASPRRRVAGTRLADYLPLLRLIYPPTGRRISEVMDCRGVLWDRLVGPFLLGALNTDPRRASATLAAAVIRQSLARGGKAYRVRIAHPNLSAAFVDPALAFLSERGARVRFGQPVRGLAFADNHVASLATADGDIPLRADEAVILAAPPWIARTLVPGLTAPDAFNTIVNGHFAVAAAAGAAPMVGVIGGTAEWIFAFADRLSVTVSGADHLANDDRQNLARRFWRDIAAVHRLGPELPPWRIVKERRATFAATPEQDARRPAAATAWRNLFLAGDWTATGLPATIEGAIRSGHKAAAMSLECLGRGVLG